MSRSEVRIDSDGRRFVYLEGSNRDRYRHLESNRHCYSTLPKDREKRLKKQERYCVFFSVIISIASITCSGLLFYLYLSRSVKLADDFCVPCDKVECHHEKVDCHLENEKYKMLEKDYENGVEVCCASTPQSTSALMDLISERKLTEFQEQEKNAQIRYGDFKGSQISAHILMRGNSNNERGKGKPVEFFADRTLNAYMNGVNITKDRIVIFTKGRYFVYSQVYFNVISDSNLVKHDVLSYSIKQMNTNLPGSKILLDSKSTVKLEKKGDHDFRTKFMSGIFELEVGDQLFVVVSNISHISRDPKHNFIGLFLLR